MFAKSKWQNSPMQSNSILVVLLSSVRLLLEGISLLVKWNRFSKLCRPHYTLHLRSNGGLEKNTEKQFQWFQNYFLNKQFGKKRQKIWDRRKFRVALVKNYKEYILLLNFLLTIILRFLAIRFPKNWMHYQELHIIWN